MEGNERISNNIPEKRQEIYKQQPEILQSISKMSLM